MKRIMTVLVAAAILSAPVAGEAKTLEEILLDKGVITDADYQDALKKNDLAWYRPGSGITLESRDGKNVANIGGRVQARYTFEDFEDSGKDDVSEFTIRRMKLWLQGNVFSKNLTYKFQQNFGEGKSVTEDAYAAYKFHDAFALQIGQAKVGQSRQELTSSGKQLFVDRSLANDTFNLGRDIGLTAKGQFADHLVEYMAGVYNGNGPNQGNQGSDHMLAARIDINPLGNFKMDEAGWPEDKPLLNIGASYATEKMTNADDSEINSDNDVLDKALNIDGDGALNAVISDELDWDIWTTNLHAKWLGATFGAEYYRLNAEADNSTDWDADGYYVQAGYQVIPKTLELAARYSAIELTDANASAEFDKSETQVGVNYYYNKHNAKITADYTMVKDELAINNDDNIFRLQAQLIF